MQTYDVDDRTVEIFYRTLGTVFPEHRIMANTRGRSALSRNARADYYDATTLRQRLSQEPLRSGIRGAWRADGLEEFLGHYVGNAEVSKRMESLQPWPLNTDDRTVIEFAFARSVSATNVFHLPNFRAAVRAAGRDRPNIEEANVDWNRVREAQISSFVMVVPPTRYVIC